MNIDTYNKYTSTGVYVYELYIRSFMRFHSMYAGLCAYLETVRSQICGLHESVVVVVFLEVVLSVRSERAQVTGENTRCRIAHVVTKQVTISVGTLLELPVTDIALMQY